jgi:polyisoprenyl-teichoic acid--peptidoglycan teichoic acid transferase
MRISSWFAGILGFVGLILMTGLCSVIFYSTARDGVITLWEGGVRVQSIAEFAQAFTNPQDFEVLPTATIPPAASDGLVVIPSITPMATISSETVPTSTPTPSAEATQPIIENTSEPRYTDPREVNILLMGIDERIGFDSDRAYRTDTMIVLHVDPVRRTAGVISFPRDLWIEIPAFNTFDRLNNANYLGDINAYPGGGGPALLMETLNRSFGVRIDYYVMVNFTVFETVVDRLAPQGIQVCPNAYIYDDHYPDAGYGTIIVEFQPGCQGLDGTRLLQYARTRATEGGDLDRAARQQEVIEALRSHVLSAGGIQTFLTQIGPLWNDLAGSYRTNLTLDQLTGLGFLMNEISRENIHYRVIGPGYVDPGATVDGRQILIPQHSMIQQLIQETFYPDLTLTVADLQARAATENAEIRIFNATDIAGLASSTREYLIGQGASNIVEVGNLPAPTNENTVIRDYGGGRSTALWLAALLGVSQDRVQRGSDGMVASGVVVIVGPDLQARISGQ